MRSMSGVDIDAVIVFKNRDLIYKCTWVYAITVGFVGLPDKNQKYSGKKMRQNWHEKGIKPVIVQRTVSALLLSMLMSMLLVGCGSTPDVPQPPPAKSTTAADLRVDEWRALMAEKEAPEPRQLALVNDFFNRLYFESDRLHWGQEDYWATPEETLRSNGGDCEDFVIGKYFTLRELQVPDERLRLTYVLIVEGRQPHMVLAYYPTPAADPLVLDILIGDIVPASQRTDLKFVYGFNSGGLWVAGRNDAAADDPARHLSRWRELLRRIDHDRRH